MQQYALDLTVVLADCVPLNFCNLAHGGAASMIGLKTWVFNSAEFVFTAISVIFLFFLILLVSIVLCYTYPLHVLFYYIKKLY